MRPLGSHEERPFLEPPHSHDVTNIAHLASIPTSLLDQIPADVQDALWALQESTSVVYASYSRLQEIVYSRFDRLVLLPNDPEAFNEGAFFTYRSQLTNERSYLLDDCLPDWKHKLSHVDLTRYGELPMMHGGRQITAQQWLDRLRATVLFWANEARSAEIPDFEETVIEYRSQSTTPTSLVSCDSFDHDDTKPVEADRKDNVLGPSKYTTGLGREIEEVMGVKRAES
jgi:hypothetical protein